MSILPARLPGAISASTAALVVGCFSSMASGQIVESGEALVAGRTAHVAEGVVELTRLTGPIVLDGFSNEEAWKAVRPLPLTMYEPTFRGESQRRIEVLVAYDDEAIYVAGRFYHDDPDRIRAFSLTRDRWSGDDGFGILLDTFNDNENALRFVGLPLGTRMDMSISGDGQNASGGSGGLGPRNLSWNSFWDHEARITQDGWFGEMRIPLSSLRFETGPDGSVVMGMMAYAYEPAEGIRWTFPAIPPAFPYTQVSAMQDVRLQGVQSRNPIYVSPFGLMGTTRSTDLVAVGDRYAATSSESYEVGVDVKINPTPNLTLDLTANTDFAAVEADQQQVNLTRFSLFFEEKRPFFQERAGIFAFETGADQGTLFYSRRIGLADGEPVRIQGGARLVGRLGGWDVGAINMQTAAYEDFASENFGVVRLRRRILNQNSYVGGMTTSRIGRDGLYNVTYGLDGLVRVAGNEYVTLKWLQTFQGGNDALDNAVTGLEAGRLVVDWTRRQLQGLSYRQAFVWSGPGYDPGVGYEARSNFMRGQSDWNYQWFPGKAGRLRRVWVGVESNAWLRRADDRVDTGQLQPFVQFETKPGATVKASVNTTYEDVLSDFELSDETFVPVGTYWATEGILELRAARGWTVRPNVTLTAGEFFDGTRTGINTQYSWTISPHLDLRGGWEWNRIRFDSRESTFDAHLVRIQADGAIDNKLSLSALAQYNSLTEQMATNTRLRYNFREGQDLWLVWNSGLTFDRDVPGLPRRPLEEARTLTMKYTHTFAF